MERMGHGQIQTTQKYLHTLPDSDKKNIDAFSRIANRRSGSAGTSREQPAAHFGGPPSTA
jgi:hypothetical protein